jgi:hypothetical protein
MNCVPWIHSLGRVDLGTKNMIKIFENGFHRVKITGYVRPTIVPVQHRSHSKHCVVAAVT